NPLPVLNREELLAIALRGYGEVASHGTQHESLTRILVAVLGEGHLDGRQDEEDAEDVQDPVVASHQLRADYDHDASHHERAQNPPEENPVLVLRWYSQR